MGIKNTNNISEKDKKEGIATSIASGICYGANGPLSKRWGDDVKAGAKNIDGYSTSVVGGRAFTTGLRELVAFLTVMVTILIRREKINPIKKLRTSKAARILAISALLGGPIAALARFTSIDMIGSGRSGIFTGLWLIFLPIASVLMLRKRYHAMTWIGVAIMVGGGLVTAADTFNQLGEMGGKALIGILLALITGITWAVQHVLVEKGMRNLSNDVTSSEANVYRYGISAIVYLFMIIPIVFAIEGVNMFAVYKSLSLTAIMWLVILGIDAGISNVLYFFGIKKLGSVWSSALYNLYVPAGIVWALIINGEKPSPELIISAIVVFAGMTLANIGSNKETK